MTDVMNYIHDGNSVYAAAIDMDGVTVNTMNEAYYFTAETWKALGEGKYPFSLEEFSGKIRSRMQRRGDLLTLSKALLNNEPLDDIETLRERYPRHYNEGGDIFKSMRAAVLKSDPGKVLSLSPLYDGVKDMYRELNAMKNLNVYIVSSKDMKAIKSIVDYYKLPVDGIVSDKIGGQPAGRPEQFMYLEKHGIVLHNTIHYDDCARNLEEAEILGITPVAAPQGFDPPEKIAPYIQSYPEEFPVLVRVLFGV
ncbi:MAG: hypothetical protein J7K54_05275 [Candidatus Aenigmarchaeota archaeon]|nr:hypothetical protein [Candidatus Aenigmarchaeota archaeon]